METTMLVKLCYLDQVPGSHVVGLLDGNPLRLVGRTAFVGETPMEGDAFRGAFYRAIDEAAHSLFGSEWAGPLTTLSGLNQRTCAKDRVWKNGLPGPIVRALAWAAEVDGTRAFGDFLQGVARTLDAVPDGISLDYPDDLRLSALASPASIEARVARAVHLVSWVRSVKHREKLAFAQRNEADGPAEMAA